MASINLETITEAIDDDNPCGPDLDMEFDMDFMNFMAGIEGDLPTSYFSFEPSDLNFSGYYDQIGDFLERTRDIRLLVPLAKLYILQGNLQSFADTLDALHRLLKERWSDVHPQPMDGDYELRMAYLYPLDDMPNSVLPFQHATMFRSRRSGPITLRKWQVAKGDVNAREDEDVFDMASISQAFSEAEADDIEKARAVVEKLRNALSGIRTVCIEEAGFDAAVSLERLPQAVEAMSEMISAYAGGGDDAAEGEPGAEGGAAASAAGSGGSVVIQLPAGAVPDRESAIEALHAAAKYFALKEPASPVPVILREAQAAASKNFYELVNELVPDHAGSAVLSLGKDPYFEVSLYTLDSRNPAPDYESESAEADDSSWEAAGLEDEVTSDNDQPDPVSNDTTEDWSSANDEPAAAQNDDTATSVENDTAANDAVENDTVGNDTVETAENDSANDDWSNYSLDDAPSLGGEEASNDTAEADASEESESEPPAAAGFVANSRPEAVALMEKVLEYYRIAEPSSPVPLLVERAIAMSAMSFMDLLKQMLPDGSLKTIPKPGEETSDW